MNPEKVPYVVAGVIMFVNAALVIAAGYVVVHFVLKFW